MSLVKEQLLVTVTVNIPERVMRDSAKNTLLYSLLKTAPILKNSKTTEKEVDHPTRNQSTTGVALNSTAITVAGVRPTVSTAVGVTTARKGFLASIHHTSPVGHPNVPEELRV